MFNLDDFINKKEPKGLQSTHYRDQLFRETERVYKRNTGDKLNICRNTLTITGDTEGNSFMETKVRTGDVSLHISFFANPKWSLEKNSFKFAQAIAKKFKRGLLAY